MLHKVSASFEKLTLDICICETWGISLMKNHHLKQECVIKTLLMPIFDCWFTFHTLYSNTVSLITSFTQQVYLPEENSYWNWIQLQCCHLSSTDNTRTMICWKTCMFPMADKLIIIDRVNSTDLPNLFAWENSSRWTSMLHLPTLRCLLTIDFIVWYLEMNFGPLWIIKRLSAMFPVSVKHQHNNTNYK
jgi:hypothetical protein